MTVPALTSIQNADIPKTAGAQRQSPNAAPANFADQLSISLGQHGRAGGREQPVAILYQRIKMHITNSNVTRQNAPSSSIHNGKFGEIVQQYNFNKISHDEIQQIGKKLRDAGAITDEQFLDITAPYFTNLAMNGSRSSADKINYPEELHKLMLFQQKSQATDLASLAHIQKIGQYFDQLSKGIPLINARA